MYSCTMPLPDPGGPEEAVRVLKFAHYMILRVYTVMDGGLGCFGVDLGVSMDRPTVMLTVK